MKTEKKNRDTSASIFRVWSSFLCDPLSLNTSALWPGRQRQLRLPSIYGSKRERGRDSLEERISCKSDTEIGAEGSGYLGYTVNPKACRSISARFQNRTRPWRHVECICAHSSRLLMANLESGILMGFSAPFLLLLAFPVSRVSGLIYRRCFATIDISLLDVTLRASERSCNVTIFQGETNSPICMRRYEKFFQYYRHVEDFKNVGYKEFNHCFMQNFVITLLSRLKILFIT